MKKWIIRIGIGIGILVAVLVACIYIFVPGTLNISQVTPVNCSPNGAYRSLVDTSKWKLWWPGQQAGTPFRYSNYSFYPMQTLPHGKDVVITGDELDELTRIIIMPLDRSSA